MTKITLLVWPLIAVMLMALAAPAFASDQPTWAGDPYAASVSDRDLDVRLMRMRRMAAPLYSSRNAGLDMFPNIPQFETSDTLPPMTFGAQAIFNYEISGVDGIDGEYAEALLRIDFAPIERLEFHIQGGLANWNGEIDVTSVGIDGNKVNNPVELAVADLIAGVKFEIIKLEGAADWLSLAVRAQVKIPLGGAENFVSNDEFDVNFAVLATFELKDVRLFAMIGGVYLFDDGTEIFGTPRQGDALLDSEEIMLVGSLGAAVPVFERLAVIAQAHYNTAYRNPDDDTITIEGGVRVDIGSQEFGWYVTATAAYAVVGDSDIAIFAATEILFGF